MLSLFFQIIAKTMTHWIGYIRNKCFDALVIRARLGSVDECVHRIFQY